MSTPQPRVKLMATAPIHHLKSDFLSKSDVSATSHYACCFVFNYVVKPKLLVFFSCHDSM